MSTEIKRFDKSNVSWTAKALSQKMDQGLAKFDNAVQRTLVWTREQKSLLIHSMIIGAPVPPMYASKNGKEYDFLDGKQRSHAIHSFLNNEFALVDVPETKDVKGKEIQLNGLMFSDLPEEIQDYIKDYSLVIYTFDGLTEEEIADIFYRLNSGSDLKSIDKNLAKMPSLPYIIKVSKHPIFEEALTKRAIEKKYDKDIVIKSFIMLKQERPGLDARNIKTFTRTIRLTDKDVSELKEIYDVILQCATQIREFEVDKYSPVKNGLIARRILGRSHIVSVVPFIRNHKDEDILYIRDFLYKFFSGNNENHKASIAPDYNDASTQGSGHKDNVERRQKVLEREWEKFMRKK